MQDMAEDVLAVIEAVEVERAHVLGSSMGGMISQCLASAYPERVGRLVLMSTHSGGPGLAPPEPRAAATFMPAPTLSVGEVRRRALEGVLPLGFPEAHPDVIDRLVRLREQAPTSAIAWRGQYAAILASDRSQLVGRIRARTLVLHGDLDPLIAFENGKRLAERIPGAKFELLPGCGHMPYIEQPELTARAVLDFLQG
jgi:pimeloyl-ACP methyl ester carboxylesterase